jgi:hypothetical protein
MKPFSSASKGDIHGTAWSSKTSITIIVLAAPSMMSERLPGSVARKQLFGVTIAR